MLNQLVLTVFKIQFLPARRYVSPMCPDNAREHDRSTAAYVGFEGWYRRVPSQRRGFPPKGTIGGALVVLERLRDTPDLEIRIHTAPGGSQVAGVNGGAVNRILSRYGENRRFLSEGGRTNLGLRGSIERLLEALTDSGFSELDYRSRASAIDEMQAFLVQEVRRWQCTQPLAPRLDPKYDPARPIWYFVRDLLVIAMERGANGPVAEYLVGAKLQLRFPNREIRNTSYSTADTQPGVFGDFDIEDTVFHVTVSPMPALFDKCKENLRDGKVVYIVTPFGDVAGTVLAARERKTGPVVVASVEGFVSQNLDEMSEFKTDKSKSRLKELLGTYNKRVDAVETDKSLLIKLPPNL